MDALTAIKTRRSIRKYKNKPVPDEVIDQLLEAGMMAPSAGNEQPWHFIVVKDRAILDKVPTVHPYSKMITQATVAILVCGDIRMERHTGFWVQDCSAATQNILLAAHALGLASVWLGVYPAGDRIAGISELFGLPEYVYPLSLLPIGYPDEEKLQPERFDKSRVRIDKW
jgi:nitroreductase